MDATECVPPIRHSQLVIARSVPLAALPLFLLPTAFLSLNMPNRLNTLIPLAASPPSYRQAPHPRLARERSWGITWKTTTSRHSSLFTRHYFAKRSYRQAPRPRCAGTFMWITFVSTMMVSSLRGGRDGARPSPSVTATSGCLLLSLSASPLLSWAASPPYEVIGKRSICSCASLTVR